MALYAIDMIIIILKMMTLKIMVMLTIERRIKNVELPAMTASGSS